MYMYVFSYHVTSKHPGTLRHTFTHTPKKTHGGGVELRVSQKKKNPTPTELAAKEEQEEQEEERGGGGVHHSDFRSCKMVSLLDALPTFTQTEEFHVTVLQR